MKNTANVIRTLCEVGLFAALGFVFDELQGAIFSGMFPSGGSIGFAMIAVLIVAYRRGVLPALLTGLVMGLFDLATKAYVIHPAQVLLDYVLPYTLVGLVGLLKPMFDKCNRKGEKILWLISGAVIGGLLKLTSHYLAGIFFWADPNYFAWQLNDMNPYLYCFVYNIAFVGPSIILTGALLVVIFATAPRILTNKPFIEENESNNKPYFPIIFSSVVTAGGAFLFVFFLIKWINSFYYKESSQKYYFDQDSMVIYVLGLFLVVLGTICLISYFKNRFNYLVMSVSLSAISLISLVYAIAKIIIAYVEKELDPKLYWTWFVISTIALLVFTSFFVVILVLKKKEKAL